MQKSLDTIIGGKQSAATVLKEEQFNILSLLFLT